MTSLREEIRFYLSTYYDCASYDDAVNTIFSKIEKRIDSMINSQKELIKECEQEKDLIGKYNLGISNDTLMVLKGELLK